MFQSCHPPPGFGGKTFCLQKGLLNSHLQTQGRCLEDWVFFETKKNMPQASTRFFDTHCMSLISDWWIKPLIFFPLCLRSCWPNPYPPTSPRFSFGCFMKWIHDDRGHHTTNPNNTLLKREIPAKVPYICIKFDPLKMDPIEWPLNSWGLPPPPLHDNSMLHLLRMSIKGFHNTLIVESRYHPQM